MATTVQRLSVLLAAGVHPMSCWTHLAESSAPSAPSDGMLRALATLGDGGRAVSDTIVRTLNRRRIEGDEAWRGVAAAWMVAAEAGAPLASTLDDLAVSLRSMAQLRRDLEVALAGPVTTAKMVAVLPAIGLAFGVALGFDTVGVLVGSVPGLVCLVLGLALMVAGNGWSRRMVARAQPRMLLPGVTLELMAIALSGGVSIERARKSVERARDQCGLVAPEQAAAVLDEVLRLSARAGVPAVALLRSEADSARRATKSAADARAARLAVTLMIPLGVCVLPSFMLLGVAPLLLSVISSTVSSL